MLKYILGAGFIFLLAILFLTGLYSQISRGGETRIPFSVSNSLSVDGIEIISSEDVAFETEISKHAESDRKALGSKEASKSFAVFIRNNSSHDVVGVSLRWELVQKNGEIRIFPQSQTNPGVLEGMRPDPSMIGKTSVINKGAAKLFCLADACDGISNAGMRPFGSGGGGSLTKQNHVLDGVSRISLSIDGVFFSDGTFVGENIGYYFEEVQGMVSARRDFLNELVAAVSSGASPTDSLNRVMNFAAENSANRESFDSRYPRKTGEETLRSIYTETLDGLSKQVSNMRHLKWSDERIVSSVRSARIEDFKELRKIPQKT